MWSVKVFDRGRKEGGVTSKRTYTAAKLFDY